MSPLLSVLQPSPAARVVHARLAAVLECSTHHLLNARADVWEPGEEPEPRPVSRKKAPAKRPPTGAASHDLVFAHLSESPMTLRKLMAITGLKQSSINNGIFVLMKAGRARNLSPIGKIGQYVRTATQPKGWCDV